MAENLITQVNPTQIIQTTLLSSKSTKTSMSQDKKSPGIFKNRQIFSLFTKSEAKTRKSRFGFITKFLRCVRKAPAEDNGTKVGTKDAILLPRPDVTTTTVNNENIVVRSAEEKSPFVEQLGNNALLPPLAQEYIGKKCLVLDLDETLVHSSFKGVENADIIVPVEIEGQLHNVYVLKRPGVDEFLRRVGDLFEVVVFTASLSKYADPVLDLLDIHRSVKHRLFRESCCNHNGNYVKDLSQLGRDIRHVMIIDNSPASYIFHPTNAVPISSWFNDPHDTELLDLIPVLEDLASVDNVMIVLDNASDHV